MSRKEAISLAVVPFVGQLLSAPAELTPAQVEVWKAIVATKPADYFGADSAPILAEYCRAVTLANEIAERVDNFDKNRLDTYEGFRVWKALTNMQREQSKLVATLATKMRLSQQSRYEKKTGGVLNHRAGLDRPWAEEPRETQTG